MEKQDILSLTLPELEAAVTALGEKKFRARQIFTWLHQRHATNFLEMTDLSAAFRDKLSVEYCISSPISVKKLASTLDDTVKYLYGLSDGSRVETVLMSYHHANSLCISTQVGCKMGCAFCASTIAGFVRNLTAGEMLGQIYATERDSGRSIGSLVLMGIGEPLDNYENVIRFLRLLSAPEGRGMSLRHITVSTCGVVPMIDALSAEGFGLTLSVSLHASNDARRSEIMPVNRRYPISQLMDACRRYLAKTGRRVTFEYAVIDGVNAGKGDAEELAALLHGFPCHVNLIPVNPVRERSFHTARDSVLQFQKQLTALGVNATIRRTLGSDINAACGQLRREEARDTAAKKAD